MTTAVLKEVAEHAAQAFQSENYKLAAQLFEDAINGGYREAWIYHMRARSLVLIAVEESGEGDEQSAKRYMETAKQAIDKAISHAEDSEIKAESLSLKGTICLALGQVGDAEKCFQAAERLGLKISDEKWQSLRQAKRQRLLGWGMLAAKIVGLTMFDGMKDAWREFGLKNDK